MIHVVQPGDTLSALARRYKTSVSAFMAANPIIKNPDLIVVGWNLRVPGTSSGGATGSWGGSQPSPTLVSSGGKSDWLVYGALGVAGFFIGKSMKWW